MSRGTNTKLASELLKSTASRARKVRRLLLRCQPRSERLIAWPWNDSTQAPSACCSIAASYHLLNYIYHLLVADGLHIEHRSSTCIRQYKKLLHAVDILCISYYEACQRKKRTNSWIECLDSDSKSAMRNKQQKICWLLGGCGCRLSAVGCWGFVRAAYNFQHSSLAPGSRPGGI
jgi:hypothetical protein